MLACERVCVCVREREREGLSMSGSESWCFPRPHLSVSIGAYQSSPQECLKGYWGPILRSRYARTCAMR